MLAKALRLRCAGYGETATMADALKGAAVIIGSVAACRWLLSCTGCSASRRMSTRRTRRPSSWPTDGSSAAS